MPPSPITPTGNRPISPTRTRKQAAPVGFRAPPKPKPRPIEQLTVRELRDLRERNARILSSPSASTSTYYSRVSTEQTRIEARLFELESVRPIEAGLQNTTISDEPMEVDHGAPPEPKMIAAKQRALARFGAVAQGMKGKGSLSFDEAAEIEQRQLAAARQRKEEIQERKRRQGLPIKGEVLSKSEFEARMWAFMNHKPSDSDLEDEDEDDSDEDPSTWFEDDQDDGRKGQDIVEPDYEGMDDIIRIDESRIPYGVFYEPRDEGD